MLKTKKEIAELKRQLRAVKSCHGDCLHCKNCEFHFADCGQNLCFALACAKASALNAVFERPSQMRNEIIEALEFELS